MKRINIILLTVTIILGGIVFYIACRVTYESKKFEVQQKAKDAFVKALDFEFKSRNLEKTFSFKYDGVTPLTADLPDSVCIGGKSGMHWYRLDPVKHRMNITTDINVRLLHSLTLEETPLNTDSLNEIWKEYLRRSDKYLKVALSISVLDKDGKVKVSNSSQSPWYTPSNLVFTIYMGYACEIEIMGYLHYSLWDIMYLEILFYSLLYVVCVFMIYKISISLIVKVKSMRQIEVVQGVSGTLVRSYILHDNVLFYAEQRAIEIDGIRKKMPLQACLLLELFLNSKDHIVTDAEIMNTLWPDGSGHLKRVHKAIARLRTYLITDSLIRIERENLDTYQLFV